MPNPVAFHYSVAVADLSGHLLRVVLTIDTPSVAGHVLRLPAWIPGSYMIRDFSKNIVEFKARTQHGQRVEWHKLDKQTWQLDPSDDTLVIEYQVYAFDFSVRSAFVCDEYAFFNGTSVFLEVLGLSDLPCLVTFEQPRSKATAKWDIATTLGAADGQSIQDFDDYWAQDYHDLIDHPVLIGQFDRIPFDVSGVTFELVLAGGHNADIQRMSQDLKKICQHHFDLFDDTPPIQRYQFITLLSDDSFGGLEHRSSTALMYSRGDLPMISQKDQMPKGYQTFLSLCSHELFHTWHVKRIRPCELTDNCLDSEQYTEQLWIYEGFTSYFDDLSLVRCNLISTDDYLETLGETLTRLQRNRGRFKQSVTDSSFDAWTRFYQQDASAINNIVSYYTKGAVIALCLDLLIREHSEGKLSLVQIMRDLWQRYGKTGRGTPIDVIHQLITEYQLPLTDFLHSAIYTTDELPVAECLLSAGVSFTLRPPAGAADKGGKPAKNLSRHGFGASFISQPLGIKVTAVQEDTPAYEAGLYVGDILIAMDQWQLSEQNLTSLLDNQRTGSHVKLTLLRDKKLKCLSMPVKLAIADTVVLEAGDEEKVQQWLTP